MVGLARMKARISFRIAVTVHGNGGARARGGTRPDLEQKRQSVVRERASAPFHLQVTADSGIQQKTHGEVNPAMNHVKGQTKILTDRLS